ncbi:hypothetical protein ACFQ3Z_02330 [Streptomyces nogalater]
MTPATVLVTPPDETASIPVRWAGGEVSNTGKASVPRVSPLRPATALSRGGTAAQDSGRGDGRHGGRGGPAEPGPDDEEYA